MDYSHASCQRPDSNLYLHYKSNLLNFEGAWFFLMSDNSILPTTPWRIDDGLVELIVDQRCRYGASHGIPSAFGDMKASKQT